MRLSGGRLRLFAALFGLALVAGVVACGRIYGDGPSGDVVDGSVDAPMVQDTSASDAGTGADGDAAVNDGAAVTCSSSAPSCKGGVLATVTGDPTSVALLGDVLYWSDHSTKTIQRIPTKNGPVGSTVVAPAGGFPSRLANVGGVLAWFADSFAGTGMPPGKESGQGDTLKTCIPSSGCAASSRFVAGTSAPAWDGDGGITFGTVDGTPPTAHAIRIPFDLSSPSSQDMTGSQSALVDTTYAVGPHLVWFESEFVHICSFADCVGTQAPVAKAVGRYASAANDSAVVWTDRHQIMGVTVTAAGVVSPVATLFAPPPGPSTDITAVFVENDHVIFASARSQGAGLYRCPAAGCGANAPELVARGGADGARFIAADAEAYYWFVIDQPGAQFAVYRAPR